jgi:hypothetical protein
MKENYENNPGKFFEFCNIFIIIIIKTFKQKYIMNL